MPITKRYRVVFDYEVQVEDWSEKVIEGERLQFEDYHTLKTDPEHLEWEAKQQRLYRAIVSRPDILDDLCIRAGLDVLGIELEDQDLRFDVPQEDDIIKRAFKLLPAEDVRFWNGAIKDENFYLESEFVRNRFTSFVLDCSLQNQETGRKVGVVELEAGAEFFSEPVDGETRLRVLEAFGSLDPHDTIVEELLTELKPPKQR